MQPVSYTTMIECCTPYLKKKCYAGTFPAYVEDRIRKKFTVPGDQQLLAFFDYTILSYAKDGFAVASSGLYWREAWSNTFIPWGKLAETADIRATDKTLMLGTDLKFSMAGCPLTKEELCELLSRLRAAVRQPAAKREAGETADAALSDVSSADGVGSNPISGSGVYGQRTSYSLSLGGLPLPDAVQRVCESYARSKVYVPPIPERLHEKIRQKFNVMNDTPIAAFFDFTIFGKGREGVIFTDQGMYWKVVSKSYVPWVMLEAGEAPDTDADAEARLDRLFQERKLSLAGSPLTRQEWMELLGKVQSLPQVKELRRQARQRPDAKAEAGEADEAVRQEAALPLDELFIEAISREHAFFNKLHDYAFDPDRELSIRHSFRLPASELLIAFHRERSSGPGETGVLLTGRNLYAAGLSGAGGKGKRAFPLHLLGEPEMRPDRKTLLIDGQELYQGGAAPHLFALLNDLKLYVLSLQAAYYPIVYPFDASYIVRWNLPVAMELQSARWIIAEAGMLRGIYSEGALRLAAETGLLDPSRTACWTPGLPGWIAAYEAPFCEG